MAIGDTNDILGRLKAALPARWFGDGFTSPVLDAALSGAATVLSVYYGLLAFAKNQTRFATMQGGFLDLAAYDYLGRFLPRRTNETDHGYSTRIIKEVLRIRNTRAALIQVITDLTGRAPVLHEPWNPYDCGGYDAGYGYDVDPTGWGCYGELQPTMPYQIGITVLRPNDGRAFDDTWVYQEVERVRAAGTIVWVQIVSVLTTPPPGLFFWL